MELLKVTNDNYFSDTGHMSVSAFKLFLQCELKGLHGFGEPTDAMLVGSYVDAYVEGTLEQFKQEHPEIFVVKISENENTVELLKSKDPTMVTKNNTLNQKRLSEAKELYPECFTIETRLKADFKKAEEIIEYIENDKIIQQFLSGDKQSIMTGEINKVPFKIKMDSYSEGIAINDLKVMATITNRNGDYYDFITQYGYDIQMACYQEIVKQNTGQLLPCYIVAITKESPINSAIIHIPQIILDKALYKVEERIQHFYNVKKGNIEPTGCGKCSSCISARKESPIISMESFIDYF